MNNDGSYTFYTKGVDRLTELKGSLLQSTTGIPFNTANDLWSSFQTKFTQFINTHSGAAWAPTPTIIIPDWDKVRDVMNGIAPLNDLIP